MATCYWLGTTDTDYNVAANWDPAAVPINNDDIIFGIRGTNHSCLLNLNQSAVHPASVRVTNGFTGNIGAVGTPLIYDYLADEPGLLYEGMCTAAYFEFASVASHTHVIVQGTAGGVDALHLHSHAGDMFVTVLKGKGITIDANSVMSTLLVHGTATDPTVTIGTGVALANVYQFSGIVTCASGAAGDYWGALGGTATFTGAAALSQLDMYGTASITWNSTGAITALNIQDTSSFDVSASSGCTITTLQIYGKSVIDLENGAGTIVVTNPIRCYDRGEATLRIEAGRTLTLNAL